MLTKSDLTIAQRTALREVQLIGAKMADHESNPDSEAKRVGKLLVQYATERMAEIDAGNLNRPEYEQTE